MNAKAKRVEYLVMKFLNERRADRGLDRLTTDSALRSAAREHSRDMARRGYLAHESDQHGGPSDRVKKYDTVAENIDMEKNLWPKSAGKIAGSAVESWMQSTGHRNNILRDSHRIQGVGVWKADRDVYLTHLFSPSRSNKNRRKPLTSVAKRLLGH